MEPRRALSIRQPYAEQILRRDKKIEYRSQNTNIRERIYIYASKRPGDLSSFTKVGKSPGELPTGVLVGTIRITDCTGSPGNYCWHLADPERFVKPIKPKNRPQPVWFHPFPEIIDCELRK